jgi:hypothetical protein
VESTLRLRSRCSLACSDSPRPLPLPRAPRPPSAASSDRRSKSSSVGAARTRGTAVGMSGKAAAASAPLPPRPAQVGLASAQRYLPARDDAECDLCWFCAVSEFRGITARLSSAVMTSSRQTLHRMITRLECTMQIMPSSSIKTASMPQERFCQYRIVWQHVMRLTVYKSLQRLEYLTIPALHGCWAVLW